jgi:DUF1680 family protein
LWQTGDKIEVSLPMSLHVAAMPDNEQVQAMMYGPLVLAGRFDSGKNPMEYSSDPDPKVKDRFNVNDIVGSTSKPEAWVEPDGKNLLTFRTIGQPQAVTMVPLYQILGERYAVYWNVKPKTA